MTENKDLLWIFNPSAIKYGNSQGQIAKRKVAEVNTFSMVGMGKVLKIVEPTFPIMQQTYFFIKGGICESNS